MGVHRPIRGSAAQPQSQDAPLCVEDSKIQERRRRHTSGSCRRTPKTAPCEPIETTREKLLNNELGAPERLCGGPRRRQSIDGVERGRIIRQDSSKNGNTGKVLEPA